MQRFAKWAALAVVLLALPACETPAWVNEVEIELSEVEMVQQAAVLSLQIADRDQDGVVRGAEFLSFGMAFWMELQRIAPQLKAAREAESPAVEG